MRIKKYINQIAQYRALSLVGVTEQAFIFQYIGCFQLESLSSVDCKLHEEKPFCSLLYRIWSNTCHAACFQLIQAKLSNRLGLSFIKKAERKP